jgi:putative ABC transport system ATP-binding protein
MKNVTIECKNISKTFSSQANVQALKSITFNAFESEMILLMGPSGSGKTTLISIIGGLLNQDSGECLVLNTAINSLPEEEKTAFRGKNIGFMFQNFNLVPTLTARENVAISLLVKGVDTATAYQEADALLLQFGLDEQRYRAVRMLSGGEQQRVAIARACIHKPKIILCDEPTSFLDRERGKSIMQLLQKIKAENNCTLVVVTHDPRILEFADRILEIEDGMIKK